jgi:hypothetical protein
MKEIVEEIFKRNFDKVPEKTTPEEEIFLLKVCNALKQSDDSTETTQNNEAVEMFLSAYADTLASFSKEEQELMKKTLLADAGLIQGTEKTIAERDTLHNSISTKSLEEYLPILTASDDLIAIYTDIIAPKATQAEAKVFELANSGKDMEALDYTMTPEYHAYERFVLNDRVMASNEAQLEAANQEFLENCKKCKKGEIPEIPNIHYASTGNAKDLKALLNACPEILQMLGDMRAEANIKYATTGLTSGYIHPRSKEAPSVLTERNREIAAIIDAKPKTVLALSILSEQRASLGLPAEKFNTAEDLQKRLEKSDVRDIAKRISYIDRTASLKAATQVAESYAVIERTSRGKDVHTA